MGSEVLLDACHKRVVRVPRSDRTRHCV